MDTYAKMKFSGMFDFRWNGSPAWLIIPKWYGDMELHVYSWLVLQSEHNDQL